MGKYNYEVKEKDEGLTINQILKENFKFSARFKTKMKFQSLVDLNDTPTAGYIKPVAGDIISVRLPEESSDFPPEDIPVRVLYEDDDLLIINKQPGIIVHPTKGHPTGTLANAVMKYMQDTNQNFKIRFVNRIDMDTTGIVIVAKNANTQNNISDQMRSGTVVKKYYAIVDGNIENDITIDLPVGRPSMETVQRAVMEVGGKDAKTDVKIINKFDEYTLVELTIHTGRTHQIRVHLSHIGHPIIGDDLYGGTCDLINRQALHAYYISFIHPMTGKKLEIEAPYPDDMNSVISSLKELP